MSEPNEQSVFEKYMNTPVAQPDERVAVLLSFIPGLNEADVELWLSSIPIEVLDVKQLTTFSRGRVGNPIMSFNPPIDKS